MTLRSTLSRDMLASISSFLLFLLWFGLIHSNQAVTYAKDVNVKVRTKPPQGALIVDQSGEHSNYTTVQDGVSALSTTTTGTQSLFIYPGTYHEQIVCTR